MGEGLVRERDDFLELEGDAYHVCPLVCKHGIVSSYWKDLECDRFHSGIRLHVIRKAARFHITKPLISLTRDEFDFEFIKIKLSVAGCLTHVVLLRHIGN